MVSVYSRIVTKVFASLIRQTMENKSLTKKTSSTEFLKRKGVFTKIKIYCNNANQF